ELAADNNKPITVYINSAGGNVTDGLAIHDSIRHIVSRGIEVTGIVQGMAYSMGSIVLRGASEGGWVTFPPPHPRPRHRGHGDRPGYGLLEGIDRPAGGKRRPAARLPALLDHDPRAGEVGWLAVDDGGRAASRTPEA